MPIQVTDEALDLLDRAPEGEKRKALEALAPEDRQLLLNAIPAWRSKRELKSGLHQSSLQAQPPTFLGELKREFWDKPAAAVTSGINQLQKDARFATRELMAGAAGNPDSNALIPGLGEAGAALSRKLLPEGVRNAAGLLTGRAFEGLNPFTPQDAVEGSPIAEKGALALENTVGTMPAASAQVAAQQVPNVLMSVATGAASAAKAVPQVATSIWGAIKQAFPQAVRATASGIAENALTAPLSAPEGQRLETIKQTALDSKMLAVSFLGGSLPIARTVGGRQVLTTLPRNVEPQLAVEVALIPGESVPRIPADMEPTVIAVEGDIATVVEVKADGTERAVKVPADSLTEKGAKGAVVLDADAGLTMPQIGRDPGSGNPGVPGGASGRSRAFPRTPEWYEQTFGGPVDLDTPRLPPGRLAVNLENGRLKVSPSAITPDARPDWVPPREGDAVRVLAPDGSSTAARLVQDGPGEKVTVEVFQPLPKFRGAAAGLLDVDGERIEPGGEVGPGKPLPSPAPTSQPVLTPRPKLKPGVKPAYEDPSAPQPTRDDFPVGGPPQRIKVARNQVIREIRDIIAQRDGADAQTNAINPEVLAVQDQLGRNPGAQRFWNELNAEPVTGRTIQATPLDAAKRGQVPMGGAGLGERTQLILKDFSPGERVYVDRGSLKGDRYDVLEVVGRRGGKVLVRSSSAGTPYEVDAKLLRKVSPVPNAAPLPPVNPVPGQIPPHLVEEVTVIKEMARYNSRDPSMLERAYRALVPAGLRGSPQVAQHLLGVRAGQNLLSTMGAHQAALRRALQGSLIDRLKGDTARLLSTFDKDLESVARGEMGGSVLAQKYPSLWPRIRQTFEPMLKKRDHNHQRLRELGMLPEDIDQRIEEDYLARMYFASTLKPGEWARRSSGFMSTLKPGQSVLDVGIQFLLDQNKRRGKLYTPAEVADSVNRLLRSTDPLKALNDSKDPVLQQWKHLKKRQDLPKELRELMGEIHSGTYRMAVTLGVQDSLVALGETFDAISQDPILFSPGPQPGFRPIPNAPSYGHIAGGYVRADVWEGVINAPETVQRAPSWLRTLMGNWKTNLVAFGGPGSWVREIFNNLGYSVLAGGLDITRPLASGQSFLSAWRAYRAYGKSPASTGLSALVHEAQKVGAIDPGFGHAEIRDAHRRMLDVIDGELRKAQGADMWSLLGALRSSLARMQKLKGDAWAAWDHIQQTMRLTSYLNLRRKFLGQGMALPDAQREAGRRVALSFPSPNNLGPAVQEFRQGAMGFAAPFLTPVAEDARILLQLPGRLRAERDLKWRLGTSAIVLGGAFGVLNALRRVQGISDEEVEAAQNMVTRRQATYRPVLFAGVNRDEKGRVELNDLTWTWTGWRLLQGDPEDALWRRILSNMIATPVEGTPYEEKLRELLAAGGVTRPPPEQYKMPPGEGDLLNLLKAANRSGLAGPAVIGNTMETLRQGGVVGTLPRSREQLTPSQMLRRAVGLPVLPVSVPRAGQAPSIQSAYREAMMEDYRQMNELQRRMGSPAATPEQREAVKAEMQVVVKRIRERQAALQRFQATPGGQQ